jgi:argininosuccinate lyase
MAKLWQKNYQLNELIENFTVGEDYQLDNHLLKADCVASLAHATMLQSIGLLTSEELTGLKQNLIQIIHLHDAGQFPILKSDEDGHTAIENYLVEKTGEAGKKIHTGRSRNDQVITALRLMTRDFLLSYMKEGLDCVALLFEFAREHRSTPMPGRTHMQIAMPSSVGLWAAAYAEGLLDDLKLFPTIFALNNTCPLGSAASYGVPLPLNRALVAELLAFDKVQNNVLYVNNSRGKMESLVLDAIYQVMLTLSKLTQELILYSLPEFGYFALPDELCSGSSIMPQKKNPDGLELIRAKTSTLGAYAQQIKMIIQSLPSGYNRDFQETKGPFMRGISLGEACLVIMQLTIQKLKVSKEKLLAGFTPDIYATDAALELVSGGMAFRDAYREVGAHLSELKNRDPYAALQAKNYQGTTGSLNLELGLGEKKILDDFVLTQEKKIRHKVKELAGFDVTFYQPFR